MKNVYAEIRENYKVDGETERYATLFNSKEEVVDEMDVEIFEEKFNKPVDEVKYPIITFDFAGSSDGWLFEAGDDKEHILNIASDYFEKK